MPLVEKTARSQAGQEKTSKRLLHQPESRSEGQACFEVKAFSPSSGLIFSGKFTFSSVVGHTIPIRFDKRLLYIKIACYFFLNDNYDWKQKRGRSTNVHGQ